MMKQLIFGIVFFGIVIGLQAQQQNDALKKIESAKIALISERLDLTPEQAERFWPVYNEYYQRQKEIRSNFQNARREIDPKNATEEENKRLLEMGMQVKENQVRLEKEYTDRMLKVISSRQMVELRKAESDFRNMLVERLRSNNITRQQINERMKNEERQRQQRNN
jgi:DNA polymerase III delta prime subunit